MVIGQTTIHEKWRIDQSGITSSWEKMRLRSQRVMRY